ncbi:MAG: IS6 family transposase [Legionellaceae bacterium]|nr:IS6 family transposase [Legionellaceae bacterium]
MRDLIAVFAYPLSYRNIEELMAERNIKLDHSAVQKWVVHYSPQLESSFRKRKKMTGGSWRIDETYIKVSGKWVYLYRAVDKAGKTVDFMLSDKRDRTSVLKFFKKAIGSSGIPENVNIDKSGSKTAAFNGIHALLFLFGLWHLIIEVRRVKSLNKMVEQDYRGVKKATKVMTGFKSFEAADATLSSIELHHMLKKNQLDSDGNQPVWKQFYELAA